MQGVQLAMFNYIIGVLLLIKRLKLKHTDVTHPWYADDAVSLGTFDNLEQYFNLLKHYGLDWGYYPKRTKSILIMNPKNLKSGELFK